MERDIELILGIVFLIIGGMAIAMNSLLINTALSIPNRSLEVDCMVVLAIIDIILPGITIGITVSTLITGIGVRTIPIICFIKGPVDFIGSFASMLLVTIIGVHKYERIFKLNWIKHVWIFFIVYSLGYTSLVFITWYRNEFLVSPSGIDCAPNASNSLISSFMIFSLGFSLLCFLIATLFCYLRITLVVAITPPRNGQLVYMKDDDIIPDGPLPSYRTRIQQAIRPLIISLTYFTLIAPSCLLIMTEAIYHDKALLQRTSMAISLFLYNISLANPCLVLFGHTSIYNQLKLRWFSPFS